jgi:uncharacterized protein YcbK (DUF882 family)
VHAVATAALAAALVLAPAPALAEVVHVVAKGQTLGRIAKRYNVSVDTLREVNGLEPGQRIFPGLKLVVPEKGKEGEALKKAREARAKKEKETTRQKSKDDKQKDDKQKDDKQKDAKQKDAKQKADKSDKRARGEKERPDREDAQSAKASKDKDKADRGPRAPKKPGFVRMVHGSDRLETQLLTRKGKLLPAALPGLSRLLRFWPTNAKIAIDPRLATLIGMVSDHFGGKTIHVVSGYRPYSPSQYTPHSNHNFGRALDFYIEGVPNSVLRDYCRTIRNAGVGYYPNSSFVHLDVRSVKTYWVDYSGPGEAPRYEQRGAPVPPDEAVRDVPPAPDPGSEETPPPPLQVPDPSDGKADSSDPGESPRPEKGPLRPTPGAAPDDPYGA